MEEVDISLFRCDISNTKIELVSFGIQSSRKCKQSIKCENNEVEFFRTNGIQLATFGLLIDIASSIYLNVRLRAVVYVNILFL